MKQGEFRELVQAAARQAVEHLDYGVIGHLVLTQAHGKKGSEMGQPKIREPEMRHAFAQVAEGKGLAYGIEVPTKERYRFANGDGARTHARHDLVFFAEPNQRAERQVLVELKEGRPPRNPDDKPIRKDFVKFLREEARGKSFVHVLSRGAAAAVGDAVSRYSSAYKSALIEIKKGYGGYQPQKKPEWFSLFVLVVEAGSPMGGKSRLFAVELGEFAKAARDVEAGLPPFSDPPVELAFRE